MPEPTPAPILGLSTAEAARILGVHVNSISRYVARGLLHRTSSWYTLDRDEVEQLALQLWKPGHPYWIGTAEAADLLGISLSLTKRKARRGVLPTVRHGRRWFFRRHQLEVIANARDARRQPLSRAITVGTGVRATTGCQSLAEDVRSAQQLKHV